MKRLRHRPPDVRLGDTSALDPRIVEIGHPFRALGPPRWLLTIVLCLIAGYLTAATSAMRGVVAVTNLLGPSFLGLAAAVAGFQLLRRKPEAIWSPYAWFLAAIVAFYCIGPLLHPLAQPATRRLASHLYRLTSEELLRTNLLDAVGVFGVLVGVRVVRSLLIGWKGLGSTQVRRMALHSGAEGTLGQSLVTAEPAPAVGPAVAAVTFLVVGGILQYLVILPTRFGMLSVVLPGILWNLGRMHLLGIAVLAYVVARGDKGWHVLLVVLWAMQVAVSILLFSKLELILSLLLPALGGYAGHRSARRLLLWGVAAAAVYLAIPQFVLYGREQVYNAGGAGRVGLTERFAIVRGWLDRGRPPLNEDTPAAATAWARLDYAPVQAFAMKRFDDGYPGHTLKYAAIVLVPRVLWPTKPVTTDLGVDFYELLTGRRSTHLGLGVFGEGYWNRGWAGVLALSLVTGLVLALVSGLSIAWMQRREFLFLPAVALGMQMGRTTGTFANGVVGAFAIIIVYSVAVSTLVRLLRPIRHSRTGQSGFPLVPHTDRRRSSLL